MDMGVEKRLLNSCSFLMMGIREHEFNGAGTLIFLYEVPPFLKQPEPKKISLSEGKGPRTGT
jgi:hypothetical protein